MSMDDVYSYLVLVIGVVYPLAVHRFYGARDHIEAEFRKPGDGGGKAVSEESGVLVPLADGAIVEELKLLCEPFVHLVLERVVVCTDMYGISYLYIIDLLVKAVVIIGLVKHIKIVDLIADGAFDAVFVYACDLDGDRIVLRQCAGVEDQAFAGAVKSIVHVKITDKLVGVML